MNKAFLVGRLCQDPEVRYTQAGKAVASFTIAVNEGYGERKTVQYIPIVCWEKLAEACGNNLNKGSKVLVEGKLQIRSYDANDGSKRRIAEVIAQNMEFLEKKQQGEDNPFGGTVYSEEEIPGFETGR